jgi:NodT family efflux transporter outer membrane factor (OMF) lipoprotein
MSEPAARGRPSRACCALVIALGLTSGCAVGPNFSRPSPPAVEGYETEPVTLPDPGGSDPAQRFVNGGAIAREWWELFRSPALDEVLTAAIEGSPTLVSARATLRQAEEVVLTARAAYYPQADLVAQGSYDHARSLSGASFNNFGANGGRSVSAGLFNVGPALSYTPDLFGGTRRLVEQQSALAQNQVYQLGAAYLTLTANTVTQAITIASTLEQIKAANDIIAADEHNLELVRISFEAGNVARTDVLSAESQLAGDRTLLPPLEQQLAVARHALSVLVGKTPGEWAPPPFELETLTLPGNLPVTIPSQLVHDRPDILSIEAQLHSASAAIGVATAQLYPSVTISPSVILEVVGGPVTAPSLLASIAGTITTPIFHGGALEAQRRGAIDAYEAQLGVYRQTLLTAFGQVADTLRALQHDAQLLAAETAAVAASEASLELSQEAYAAGRGSLVQVLDAQRLFAQAVLGYARAKGQRYLDTALLFEAMGGDARAWMEARAETRSWLPGGVRAPAAAGSP